MKKVIPFIFVFLFSNLSYGAGLTCSDLLKTYAAERLFNEDSLKQIEFLASSILSLKMSLGEFEIDRLGPSASEVDRLRLLAGLESPSMDLDTEAISESVAQALVGLALSMRPERQANRPDGETKPIFDQIASHQYLSRLALEFRLEYFLRLSEDGLEARMEELRRYVHANIDAIVANARLMPDESRFRRLLKSTEFKAGLIRVVGSAVIGLGGMALGTYVDSSTIVAGSAVIMNAGWVYDAFFLLHSDGPSRYQYNYDVGGSVRVAFTATEERGL